MARPDGTAFAVTANGSDAAFVVAEVQDGNGNVVPDGGEPPDTNNESIFVDLGARSTISRVVLTWEAAFATGYQIQTSASPTGPWTTIFSTTTGDGGTDDLTVSGSGRYVRMNGTQRALAAFGYSLWELQVFGTQP